MVYSMGFPVNEEVLVRLLEKAINIEEANINIVLRLFIAEDDMEGRKILYELLRDSEYHKTLVLECLRTLRGSKHPESMKFKEYEFEDMFYAEKSAILKSVITVLMDFYTRLLEDIKQAETHGTLENTITKNICVCLDKLVKEKERHLKLVENIWKL